VADRVSFDQSRSGTSSKIGSGRFVARLRTDGVERSFSKSSSYIAPGAAGTPAGRMAVPEASVGKGGVKLTSAGEGFAVARDRGLQSVPVAMKMKDWRAAAKAGLIAREGSGTYGNKGRRATSQASLFLQIDLTDMWNLAAKLNGTATAIRVGHAKISQAINFGLRRLRTRVTDQAVQWTGIRRRGEVLKGFRMIPSTPATMTGVLRVRDYHRAVTSENFGASWSRSNPGATHRAWSRPQLAVGAFMIPGKKPIFRRVGQSRFPIEPLWGPNVAREIERHRPEVQAQVDMVGVAVRQEAVALMRVAITGSRRS
jgi:hypothetical protein